MSKILWDPFHSSVQWNSLVFFTVVFVMGVVFGSLTVNSLAFVQKQDLFFYLEQFFQSWNNDPGLLKWELFRNSYLNHVLQLSLIFILGLSVIGLPVVIILLFLKGVYFGFSVGFLVHQMGWKGLGIASLTIAPHNIITIPVYIVTSWMVGMFAVYLSSPLWSGERLHSIRADMGRYGFAYFLALVLLLVSSVAEVFLSQPLLELLL
ncbi:stage II sporulation protein M [Salimicrobium halophilum]|uniref:Stage II sporulation protein M n=1 Tax=Salimicrobium halophilum TaxID=86666 RepID=A0A1G8PXK2_9BACI|nr:stage II sporulation protein M [Salimicrobium halophilum]SDI96976.1 stage II sporulation protein M [Salimicrobium halophilum]